MQASCTPVNKTRIRNVFIPDTQLFAISASKVIKKDLNNLQKEEIYKIENSECALTEPIEKPISICCYCECLSGSY